MTTTNPTTPDQGDERRALLMALAQLRWLAFGECRTEGWEGAPPTAAETEKALTAALAQPVSAEAGKGASLRVAIDSFKALREVLLPAFEMRGVSLRVSQEDHEAIRSALAGASTGIHLLEDLARPSESVAVSGETEALATAVEAFLEADDYSSCLALSQAIDLYRIAHPVPAKGVPSVRGVGRPAEFSSTPRAALQRSEAVSGEVSDAQIDAVTFSFWGQATGSLQEARRRYARALLALAGSAKQAAALERMARIDDEIGDAP